MLNEIWVLAECQKSQISSVTAEILTACRRLANKNKIKVAACLLGPKSDSCIAQLGEYGAEKIYLIESELLSEYYLDIYTSIFKELIEKYNPLLLAIGATPIGNELAPRIAAKLSLPCITEIKKIGLDSKNIMISKSGFFEKAYFNFNFEQDNTIVTTIMKGEIDSETVDNVKKVEIIKEKIKISPESTRVKNIKFIKGDPNKINLQEADLIVAGGMGVNDKELSALEELAEVMGASVGGTRPFVDNNFIPFERQIGITGKFVSPKLLIALGVSGAREFTMGIDKKTTIIAINNDAKAPIFNTSELGIYGDVNDIIPNLIKVIKNSRMSR